MTARNKRSRHSTSGRPQATNGRVTPKGTRPDGFHLTEHNHGGDLASAPRQLDSQADRGHGRAMPIQPAGQRTGHRGDR